MSAWLESVEEIELSEKGNKEEKGYIQKGLELLKSGVQQTVSPLLRGVVSGMESGAHAFGPLREQYAGEDFDRERNRENLFQQILPKQESKLSSAIERAGNILPFAASGGGSPQQILRSTGIATAGGEGAKQLGLGPLAEAAGELIGFSFPQLGRKIIPTEGQREIVEAAKKIGATEEEVAALTRGGTKDYITSKFAQKTGKVKNVLSSLKDKASGAFEALKTSESAERSVSGETSTELLAKLQEIYYELPQRLRGEISEDYKSFVNGELSGKNIIDFWQKIQDPISRGSRKIGRLKEPLTEMLKDISPSLADDYLITNKVYAAQADVAKLLKPGQIDKFIDTAESIGALSGGSTLIAGMLSGNYPLMVAGLTGLGAATGTISGRKLAAELVTNPRLQNLTKQMATAISKGRYGVAQALNDHIIKEIVKENPEAAQVLEEVDFTQLKGGKPKKVGTRSKLLDLGVKEFDIERLLGPNVG